MKVEKTYVAESAALGVTSVAIAYRGDRYAMVLRMKRIDGNWLINDIDLKLADGLKDDIKRFLAEHSESKEVE